MVTYCGPMAVVQDRTRLTPPPVSGGRPPRRGGLWWLWLILGLSVLVVAFGAFAGVFIANYQPLQADPGGANAGVFGDVQNVGSFLPPGEDTKLFVGYLAPYQDGKYIELGFTIINREYFPVTVEQIGGVGGEPLRQVSVRVGSDHDFGTTPPSIPATHPFRPFKVTSSTATYVSMRYQYAGCTLRGSGETVEVSNVFVVYRAFGQTYHVFLPLPYSIRVFGRAGCSR